MVEEPFVSGDHELAEGSVTSDQVELLDVVDQCEGAVQAFNDNRNRILGISQPHQCDELVFEVSVTVGRCAFGLHVFH